MLTSLLVFSMIAISIGLVGLLFDNSKRNVMNQYCYSECMGGKHYKEKGNMNSIF